jgi:hypothetical protein
MVEVGLNCKSDVKAKSFVSMTRHLLSLSASHKRACHEIIFETFPRKKENSVVQ